MSSAQGRRNGWGLWIATLFMAEEIPASIVTFVAILMFLQTGTSPAIATCYCGLLFLPWVLKSFLRAHVRRMGYFRRQLQWLELSFVAVLMALAFTFLRYTHRSLFLFVWLFVLSFLTAWHELAARMYYERMFRPRIQRIYNTPKIIASQSAVVLTYGLLIMFVGALQVFYRRIPRSWTEGCYLIAGALLFFALYHLFALHRPNHADPRLHSSPIKAVRDEMRVIDRIRQKPLWLRYVVVLTLLLLPQSLMFYSRVLFLYLPKADGGLGCTIQEIGFAQGSVGVIAFSIGMLAGRQLMSWINVRRILWWYAIPLGLSPLVYLLMTYEPPTSLMVLSVATFQAQFFFGFGLSVVAFFVRYISGDRYRNTINYLYIPLVATVMLPAMSLSGWLVNVLGFRTFFLMDVLSAPVSWLYLYFMLCARKQVSASSKCDAAGDVSTTLPNHEPEVPEPVDEGS